VWFKRWDPFLNKKTTDPIILESERERERERRARKKNVFFVFYVDEIKFISSYGF
jgi:hypothetical protein